MSHNKEPSELSITRITLGSDELIVVSVPSLEPTLPMDLTQAERGVASLLLAGHSNRDIARIRGVSVRTVANQAAAVFKKIGIRRRGELGGGLLKPLETASPFPISAAQNHPAQAIALKNPPPQVLIPMVGTPTSGVQFAH